MNHFEIAKKNFDKGFWTSEMLDKLVLNGKITADQAKAIKAGK